MPVKLQPESKPIGMYKKETEASLYFNTFNIPYTYNIEVKHIWDKDSVVVGPAWLPGLIQRGVRHVDGQIR